MVNVYGNNPFKSLHKLQILCTNHAFTNETDSKATITTKLIEIPNRFGDA